MAYMMSRKLYVHTFLACLTALLSVSCYAVDQQISPQSTTQQKAAGRKPLELIHALPTNQRLVNYMSNTAMPISRVLAQMKINKVKPNQTKRIFLTIDDGPSQVTPKVLDVLKKYNVKATFFIIGSQVKGNEGKIRRIWSEGHAIGNHSYHHIYHGSPARYTQEFMKTDELLAGALKKQAPFFRTGVVRIPGGSMGKSTLVKAFGKGNYIAINWNVASADSAERCLPAKDIISNVDQWVNKKPCIVVLDHDSATKCSLPEALDTIIPYYKSKGYTFCTICADQSWRKVAAAGLIPGVKGTARIAQPLGLPKRQSPLSNRHTDASLRSTSQVHIVKP